MSQRLTNELRLLYAYERDYKLPAASIVRQLVAWEQQPLPDVMPPVPQWVTFTWPKSGEVDYTNYWQKIDYELKQGRLRR